MDYECKYVKMSLHTEWHGNNVRRKKFAEFQNVDKVTENVEFILPLPTAGVR
jgi:hypothetical protein